MKARAQTVAGLSHLSDCDAVIEAVFEDLELKRSIFTELEGSVSPDCVLASNTSSILIASIARDCQVKGRIAGMHFFNPVPLMKLVEIVEGPDTSSGTVTFLRALGERMGRTPVTEMANAPLN